MTPTEAERIGRAWLAAGGGWRPGMLADVHDEIPPLRVVRAPGAALGGTAGLGMTETGDVAGLSPDCWPDPRDAATVGCMLAAVRERWGDPWAYSNMGGGSPEIGVWHVHITRRNYDTGTSHPVSRRGPTEPEALLSALATAPKGAS